MELLDRYQNLVELAEGYDVTELLGIQKWERPIPSQLAGLMKGSFPSFIPKTDQERAQNLVKEIATALEAGLLFEATEKLEGSSLTAYLYDGVFGVCSRNIDLKETDDNSFWKVAREYKIEEILREFGGEYAIQGELVGPGIQDNIYGLTKIDFYVYDIYDIRAGVYVLPDVRREMVAEFGLKHVPLVAESIELSTVEDLLKRADGISKLADTLREGIVYKQIDGGMTFKTVSDKYLLNEKD